ncbi:MAG TPA: hypothetical protein VK689_00780, partial [Armatimonadota bacterium]|nr:hypothetical protein [Armatimonadota bacterium]
MRVISPADFPPGHVRDIRPQAVSPDGRFLLVRDHYPGDGGTQRSEFVSIIDLWGKRKPLKVVG